MDSLNSDPFCQQPPPIRQRRTKVETSARLPLRTLRMEAEAISALTDRIGRTFERTVHTVLEQGQRGGRLVFTGIGKSADVARKTVATLNSTGTPSAFLHAADALHGDLGLVGDEDVVIAVSKSGATAELVQLMPMLQFRGVVIVAMVGRTDSPVGRAARHILDVSVEQEACPTTWRPPLPPPRNSPWAMPWPWP